MALNIKNHAARTGPDALKSETEIARSVAHLLPPLLKEIYQ